MKSKSCFYYLYKITNLLNNKEYIGAHKFHKLNNFYFGSGVAIKTAITKYGKINFKKEILMLAEDYKELMELERIAVNPEYVSNKNTYNIREGGSGAEGLKGKDNPFYGKKHSKEALEKMSKAQSLKTGSLNPFYGKKHTEEYKQKARLRVLGTQCDCKRKGWWVTPYGKFRTYREAAKKLNLSTGTIKLRCRTACDKQVGFNYQIPKEFQGTKTWREQGWYFQYFGQD